MLKLKDDLEYFKYELEILFKNSNYTNKQILNIANRTLKKLKNK